MGQASSTHKISAQDRYPPDLSNYVLAPLILPPRAILDLKTQRDKLHQYQKRVQLITSRETAIAKQCLAAGDKPRALLALRRKKYQESMLSRTDVQLETLEQLTSNVEFALVQKDVMFGLKQGTEVLKTIRNEMGGMKEVEKILGDSEEQRAWQREAGDMLAGSISRAEDEEVEEELEGLEKELGIKAVEMSPGEVAPLPDAPIGDFGETQTGKHAVGQADREPTRGSESQAAEPILA